MKRIFHGAWHPFLFAIYSPLFLYINNASSIPAVSVIRSFLLSLMFAGILLVAFKVIFKDWHKAAIIASLLIGEFFLYGYVYKEIKKSYNLAILIGRHRILLFIGLVILIAGIWYITKKKHLGIQVTQALNLIGAVLILYNLGLFCYAVINRSQNEALSRAEKIKSLGIQSIASELNPPNPLPDIYYIILDGYVRPDVLKQNYGYDDNTFLNQLKKMGFYIASCAQSNYGMTALSLSSSLNMDFVDNFASSFVKNNAPRNDFGEYINHSAVGETLRDLGYKSVAFHNARSWGNMEDVDIFYHQVVETPATHYIFGPINSFERLLIDTTAIFSITDTTNLLPKDQFAEGGEDMISKEREYYSHHMYTFSMLEQTISLPGPKFVFAHLTSTHNPYVFTDEGLYSGKNFYYPKTEGFLSAITYTNKRILSFLDELLKTSSHPPIILLQADHGVVLKPGLRMEILSAYYLPGIDSHVLYPTISPVNSFRLVFDQYFGGHMKLLDDVGYNSALDTPYDFTYIPAPEKTCSLEN